MRRYWVHNIEFYDEKSCDDCDTVVKLADVQAWLEAIRDELAALFPNPSNPLFQNAQVVCAAKNDADAECLLKAMLLLNKLLADLAREE